jgi:uncharacterized repeat protein (TIGR03803 family)
MEGKMREISVALGTCALSWVLSMSMAQASSEQVVYSFCSQTNCADGSNPGAGLVAVNGILYGTTEFHGGNGTIFSFDPASGVLTKLASLSNGSPDIWPWGPLINVNGKLYGMVTEGGDNDNGGVFEFDPQTANLRTLYSFSGGSDGYLPTGGLVSRKGSLYGATYSGGSGTNCNNQNGGFGTIFAIKIATGQETVLHSFSCLDGEYPTGGLTIGANGTLYGMASYGGISNFGTVYSLDVEGSVNVLHNFDATPSFGAVLIERKKPGLFYGETEQGGDSDCGTVFQVDLNGNYKTLLSLSCTDGSAPESTLFRIRTTLYGTAVIGGGTSCNSGYGCGTVFGLDDKTGTEKMVYSFAGGSDGSYPSGNLVELNGVLYGTTQSGGAGGACTNTTYGCGTIFAITP